MEEVVETESGGEESHPAITQHDNRKVVSTKSHRRVEEKNDTKARKPSIDQKKSSKESESGTEKKKEKRSKRSTSTSVTVTRKSSPKEPSPPPEPRDVSPARQPQTNIVHVKNLVRPFTANQLKSLLGKVGKIIEDTFWIDKIKSHCIVTYENEEEAVTARKCLHGITWPSSNPKKLFVDFCTEYQSNQFRGIPNKPIPTIDDEEIEQKSKSENDGRKGKDEMRNNRRSAPEEDRVRRDRDHPARDAAGRRISSGSSPKRRREDQRKTSPDRRRHGDDRKMGRRDDRSQPLREWDRDKLDQETEHRRQAKERERERRVSPRRDEEHRKRKEAKESKPDEQPAKLLDDLFRKTKSTPCIYWLPLTDEQVETRLKEREARRQARVKARKEMEEEEAKRRVKMEAERKERAARSPDRRHSSGRIRKDSANDRKQDSRRPVDRSRERPRNDQSLKKKSQSPKPGGRQKPKAESSSDSSSSDSSSDSGSDSDDSDSGKSSGSGSPSPKKPKP